MTAQPRAVTPLYVSMADAAQVFSLSRDTFYRAANRGEITIHKRGARSLLRVSEVSDWIEGRTPSGAENGGRLVGKSGAKR
jgi:excisionase family DNA binding protein